MSSQNKNTYSIPNLKFDLFAINGDHTSTKLNTFEKKNIDI